MMAAVIVMVFLVVLALTVAAPSIARSIQRDREIEAQHRANQYVRGIRLYYKKFGHYPGSIEQLQKSNNQRFVRQKYLDPLTGKDDWRLIHVGENKTTVKGFFGEDLSRESRAGWGRPQGFQAGSVERQPRPVLRALRSSAAPTRVRTGRAEPAALGRLPGRPAGSALPGPAVDRVSPLRARTT